MDICKDLGKFKINWFCEGATKDLDREMLVAMKKAGCKGLYIGFESGSEDILKRIKPGFNIEKSYKVAEWCNDLGIKMFGSYLVGLPFETEEDIQKTHAFANKYNSGGVNWINVYVGLPGSALYDQVEGWPEDENGLRYNPNHNELVDRFYGLHAQRFKYGN